MTDANQDFEGTTPDGAGQPEAELELAVSPESNAATVAADLVQEDVLPPDHILEKTATVETEEQQAPALPFPIVGIGASAGGLAPLCQVFENLPDKTGMAFVVISHLSPDQPSLLVEILTRYTKMPVQQIYANRSPEPDNVYVLAPNQVARLQNGLFRVTTRESDGRNHLPIDQFFRSLASDQRNHAIGVILSGADSDGALGLKAIKGEGGIALVQAPETATHPGMPTNSISADHVDLIVPPEQLAVELGRLGYQFSRPEVRSLEGGEIAPTDEQSFNRVLQMLRTSSGLDVRQYKPETIRRRLARRLILLRIDTLAEYVRYLQVRPDELKKLQEDVLISVTRFFRDPEFWLNLSTNILPTFFENRNQERPIRIWCAGCSSGEEAYSLAITMIEYLTAHSMDATIQVFGTDASEDSIETARTAIYADTITTEISPERLRRFFVKTDRGYQVSKRVRDCCIFAKQNLCSDPPFSHIDFLSCRNVLIYFNQALQKQVMITFHYALESDGYMLLGMSESLRDFGDLFAAVDRKNKVYSKIGNGGSGYTLAHAYTLGHTHSATRDAYIPFGTEGWPELELQRAADRIVLARYGPPGLIVDDRMNVLQARGQTSPFVELSSGAVSWNLQRVLRDEIANDVKGAVDRSIKDNVPISITTTINDDDNHEQAIEVNILPITSAAARARCFLILFSSPATDGNARANEHISLPPLSTDEKDRIVAQLRHDLTATRFHLQSLIEERDARNQELVSANEEIQSANEELQSTNEELETTKEELQSANEELQTVNEELQQRNLVLTQTGNDLTNLLNSVNMPLLMLTENLEIRQFTPPMEKLLNVRAADIGRSISEIRLQLSIEDISPLLREVLDSLGTREVEVKDRDGRWHLLRIRPYRTSENKIEGLVVLLVDIDQLRSSQQELREARDFASSVVQSVPIPVVVLDTKCSMRSVNKAFCELTQLKENELIDRSLPDTVGILWGIDGFRGRLESLVHAEPGAMLEFEHESTTSQKRILFVKGQALSTDGDRVLLLTIEDITLRREAERMVARQQKVLEKEVEVTGKTLLRAQEQLQELAAHLLTAQEEERQHVARELHDDISQRLSSLQILGERLKKDRKSRDAEKDMSTMVAQLKSVAADVRELSHRLHPSILKDLGLPAAIKALLDEFQDREQMPVSFSTAELPTEILSLTATSLYRITQEALRNISKHAGKTHVKVSLETPDSAVKLTIRDFGQGFDEDMDYPNQGLGLVSMRERARIAGGVLEITSALGEGTTVSVTVPLDGHV